MEWLSPTLLTIQVISSLTIIVLVLLQQGQGSEMGAAFGSGSAGSLFGASGAANFLSRTTKWAAIIFFITTGGLAYIAHHPNAKGGFDSGIMKGFSSAPATAPKTAPAKAPTAKGSAVPGGSAVPSVPGASSKDTPSTGASSSQEKSAESGSDSANNAASSGSGTAVPSASDSSSAENAGTSTPASGAGAAPSASAPAQATDSVPTAPAPDSSSGSSDKK
jgi:preprotein translocase subunit SecG